MKNREISNFMKIRLLGAELIHADRQTDGHDKTNSRFSDFSKVPKTVTPTTFSMSTGHLSPIDIRVRIIHLQAHICLFNFLDLCDRRQPTEMGLW